MEVFTQEWAEACCAALNVHEGYRREGAQWTYPVVLVMTPDPASGVHERRAFHLDLHGGVCRGVRPATEADLGSVPFVLAADPAGWREVMHGADPVGALMRGRLKLMRGNVFQLSKHAGAAREMMAATAGVPARFPGD